MERTMRRGSRPIAFMAAVAFAVQFFLAAWAAGAMPAAPGLDAFGNPLCITSGDHGAGSSGGHQALPVCCVLGCNAALSFSALTPQDGAAGFVPPLVLSHLLVVPRKTVSVAAPEYRSGNPRAPPQAA